MSYEGFAIDDSYEVAAGLQADIERRRYESSTAEKEIDGKLTRGLSKVSRKSQGTPRSRCAAAAAPRRAVAVDQVPCAIRNV